MFIFIAGALFGTGCVALYNELYTRWLYHDVLKRTAKLGISEEKMKKAIMDAACDAVERNLYGQNN
jgi:hypothetical protein